MNTIAINESAGMKGRITIREHPVGTVDRIMRMIGAGNRDEARAAIRAGCAAMVQDNLIMQSSSHGKDLIIQRLIGVNTYSLNILWGEIGTGSAAPAITDTALTTPTARTATALAADSGNNTAQLQFFFPDSSLAAATYYEFGTFVDGVNSLGSGQLFNHALFSSPYVKSSGTDITVEVDITVN